jgi:hypothetical protein
MLYPSNSGSEAMAAFYRKMVRERNIDFLDD